MLLLGGTSLARRLAAAAASRTRLRVISSLAGRVTRPRAPVGEVRVGGFGGPDAMADWVRHNDIDAIIDATHPFAARITATAAGVADRTGVPLLVLREPGWAPAAGDRWHWAESVSQAADLADALGSRVLLTIGRQGVPAFAHLRRPWFLVRSIETPADPLPPRHELLLARGPFDLDGERALLRRHAIDLLVTKNSGGAATAPKLCAAREAGIPVVMVRRPPLPDVPTAATVDEALAWLAALR